jgi:hypothetical protein
MERLWAHAVNIEDKSVLKNNKIMNVLLNLISVWFVLQQHHEEVTTILALVVTSKSLI